MLICPKGTHATSEFIVTKKWFCFVYSLASAQILRSGDIKNIYFGYLTTCKCCLVLMLYLMCYSVKVTFHHIITSSACHN